MQVRVGDERDTFSELDGGGGGGLGKLLAQQLLEAREHVVDVPPSLAARVRVLGSTKASKNDSNDALATAIAGLRHCGLRAVWIEDHTAVLRMLIDRYDAEQVVLLNAGSTHDEAHEAEMARLMAHQ